MKFKRLPVASPYRNVFFRRRAPAISECCTGAHASKTLHLVVFINHAVSFVPRVGFSSRGVVNAFRPRGSPQCSAPEVLMHWLRATGRSVTGTLWSYDRVPAAASRPPARLTLSRNTIHAIQSIVSSVNSEAGLDPNLGKLANIRGWGETSIRLSLLGSRKWAHQTVQSWASAAKDCARPNCLASSVTQRADGRPGGLRTYFPSGIRVDGVAVQSLRFSASATGCNHNERSLVKWFPTGIPAGLLSHRAVTQHVPGGGNRRPDPPAVLSPGRVVAPQCWHRHKPKARTPVVHSGTQHGSPL